MMMWKLEVNGDEITWRSTLGRKKVYHFEEIRNVGKQSIRSIKEQKFLHSDSMVSTKKNLWQI